MRALVWFRSDLRVRDNPALHEACRAASDGVLGVFAICPQQWSDHDWGVAKVEFLLRNLSDLSTALARLHIPLLLVRASRFVQVPERLFEISERHGCGGLYFNDEYEVNERARDREVERLFESHRVPVRRTMDQTILDVAGLHTSKGRPYSVFGPFERAWHARHRDRGGVEVLPAPPVQATLAIAADALPAELPEFGPSGVAADMWPAGEAQAHRRLSRFIEQRMGAYGESRDALDCDGTSGISAYLALGVLSARQCLAAATLHSGWNLEQAHAGAQAWVRQLIWRDFYRQVLIGWPRVSRHRPYQLRTEALRWHSNERAFSAWCEGRTGVPVVDAGMRQLARTGWMHNRARMIVASFFSKHLWLDWRLGEAHFMSRLVDGDLANNNGGWQWSAGTGTDAAPYFRVLNPYRQGQRFDPDGEYVRRYLPELATLQGAQIHADPAQRRWPARIDYPPPIVDHDRARAHAIASFEALRPQTEPRP